MKIEIIKDEEGKELKVLTEVLPEDIKNGTVEIPSDINIIGESVFAHFEQLEKIIIPESVTEIRKRAFSYCNNLKSITLSNNIKKLPGFAFYGCTKLEEIALPEQLETIGNFAFSDCTSISKIHTPDTVTHIGDSAFDGCTSLKSIKLPTRLTTISDNTFRKCKALTEIEIPESVVTIGYNAFEECTQLKKLVLSKNISEIKNSVFFKCDGLQEIKVEKGNKHFKSVGGVLFDIDEKRLICYPTGRNSVRYEVPSTVQTIEDYAFEGVSRLKEIKLNNGIERIGDGAFKGCKNLRKITIPSTVNDLGEEAFAECKSLEKINILEGLKSIKLNTFYACEKLKEIILPNSVTSIGDGAFLACTSLKKIVLPTNLTHIEYNSFNTNRFIGDKIAFAYYKNGTLFLDKPNSKKELLFPVNLLSFFGNRQELDKFMQESDFRAFNSNFPKIESLFPRYGDVNIVSFFKFAKALGCFSTKKIVDKYQVEQDITIGQKASSVLARLVKIPPFDSDVYGRLFEDLTVFSEASQDFLEFISIKGESGYGNLRTLFILEKDYPGIFAKAMADFSTAQKCRNTIGEDGKTKVVAWDKALVKFYQESNYSGVNKDNEDIAKLFSLKDLKQVVFDKAAKMRQTAIETGIPEHILGEPLLEDKKDFQEEQNSEEESIKDSIKRIKRQTAQSLKKSTDLLKRLYKKGFYYEWLSKRDAHNPIIGLFCDCCATIENADYGKDISRATMMAPDVQNLVVKDLKDDIIAKGAVYVNSELGYAVINGFELNRGHKQSQKKQPFGGRYTSDDKSDQEKTPKEKKEEENRELIFEAFMKGITDFVKRYNELHPDNPIKQVNVGTGYNKLKKQVERFERATQKLSVPAEYSFYDAMRHDQYILYKAEDEEKEL